MSSLTEILKSEGFNVIEGHDDVTAFIGTLPKNRDEWCCSGFGVFPDGGKCKGCIDCKEEDDGHN